MRTHFRTVAQSSRSFDSFLSSSSSFDRPIAAYKRETGAAYTIGSLNSHVEGHLSAWSHSWTKRCFDVACVVLSIPFLLPLLLILALLVRCTSKGPVLFLQRRMGQHGRVFTIFKFRTIQHQAEGARAAVTTANNQAFTPVGLFLRRSKLDELPQLFNVLAGDMSLVGPRPKLPEHQFSELQCRPGITGVATIAFAREALFLERVPKHRLNDFYHAIILPAKHSLDSAYMGRATFSSDLKLIFDSVLRRWDNSVIIRLLGWQGSGFEWIRHSYRMRSQTGDMPARSAERKQARVSLADEEIPAASN